MIKMINWIILSMLRIKQIQKDTINNFYRKWILKKILKLNKT